MMVEQPINESRDIFLDNPPLQPKREIADYLEQNGILVPRRFETIELALDAIQNEGIEVIIRSEHPEEYAGASGLLDSYTLRIQNLSEASKYGTNEVQLDLKNRIRHSTISTKILNSISTCTEQELISKFIALDAYAIERYCELLEINSSEFASQISYSYWEKLHGYNRSIVADSAVEGKYHIFTTGPDFFNNYTIIDGGQIKLNNPRPLTADLEFGIDGVIEFYEKIRNINGFDPNHCPIIEFQTLENQNYFLQYHRTRDSKKVDWQLSRTPEFGEIESAIVRGATPPEGIYLDVIVYYPDIENLKIQPEQASFDVHYDFIFREIMSRRRIASFLNYDNLDGMCVGCLDGHLAKSTILNPEIFIGFLGDIIDEERDKQLFQQAINSGVPSTLRMKITSDGRKAYVKAL